MISPLIPKDPLTRREFVSGAVASGVAGLLLATEGKPPLAGSDWPMYRHDPALTATSPLRSDLKEAPRVAWSVELGGPHVVSESIQVRDVTGDGSDDFLALSSDTVTCRDSRGRVRWKLDNFLNPSVVDVLDFAGDGSRGILLTTYRSGRIDTHMIAGRTGKATHLWRDENNFGGQTRVGAFVAGVPGVHIAAAASGQTPPAEQGGPVRLVTFERGLDQPNFRIRKQIIGVFYAPLILFADIDGDGVDEMAIISHEQIWAFDPRSGGQTFYAAYGPSIRTYMATIAAIKLQPEDTRPSLVMINPSIPGLKAVRQDGKTAATELWKAVIGAKDDQYQKLVTVSPAGASLVYDLDRVGRYIIFASIKNEHGDGKTHLVLFDARTGKRLGEYPEAQVVAVDDLDGDRKLEILLRRGTELQIARWKSNSLQTVWQRANVEPVVRPLPRGGEPRLTAPRNTSSLGTVTIWREKPGSDRFLLRFGDGVHSCRLTATELEKGDAIAQHEALGNLPSMKEPKERVVWDGAKLVTMVEGREVYRYEPPAPVTYLAPPPLVADLAGQRRILVRDAAGNYQLCSHDGKTIRTFLEFAYDTPQLLVDAAGAGPLVCDVDGDGENEVVATALDKEGRLVCMILDGDGKEKRRLELLPGMTAMNRGPTGRLGPNRGRWILLRMSDEGPNHERRFLVVAYDGKTGKQLWVRDHYGNYGTNPVVFVAHIPGAVFDYDGDGADDWLVCSENFYGIISVKENKDLVGPVVLSDALPGHWTAYTFPSIAAILGEGKPVVFHHSAYSLVLITDLEGRPLWHYGMTRDTAGTWGAFADIDGDGNREILHFQPDGLIRCFAPTAPGRCPTCPAKTPLAADKPSGQRWQLDLGRPMSRPIAVDLDGDGRMELLFGGDDGNLHALAERDGKPRLLWSVSLGRCFGEPIVADIDGDGQPEILVTAEDGRLYCLRRKQ